MRFIRVSGLIALVVGIGSVQAEPVVIGPGGRVLQGPPVVRVTPGGMQDPVILPDRIQVVDGDTIRFDGKTFRLVGFDTPEGGMNAKCNAERERAARATQRLRQLIAGGGLRLRQVPCACQPGTEGTQRCNYGRYCASLSAVGRDVGDTLISEGLAHRYICSGTRCPPRQPWC